MSKAEASLSVPLPALETFVSEVLQGSDKQSKMVYDILTGPGCMFESVQQLSRAKAAQLAKASIPEWMAASLVKSAKQKISKMNTEARKQRML